MERLIKIDGHNARIALKIVEIYMNQTGVQVQADVSADGKTTLEFVGLREQTKNEAVIERDLLLIERDSLKQENEVLHQTIEKLEDEIQRLERGGQDADA